MKRIVLFVIAAGTVWTAENWWLNTQQASLASSLALAQFSGGDAAARELRAFEALKDSAHWVASTVTLIAAWLCFGAWLRAAFEKVQARFAKAAALPALLAVPLLAGGCMKPYDRPEYVEIDTAETGFLIPLEGDTGAQAKFQSEDYLKQRKVAAKRVQVTHRWSQEGRLEHTGRWIATVRLVKVKRSPVTREWNTTQAPTGSAAVQRTDKAIWIESADSVGFSMGFTCTAFIAEEDAAKFLYWYPSGSLAEVMDLEVRARVQQSAGEVAAKYPLDTLRTKKQEIADAVKNDVTNFFAMRGVTITTVGMFGGMTYENPAIQKAIDDTFIAQQLKVVSEAKFDAQKKENERIELEANATAERARREAQGQADARKLAAAAEAEAIREVNRALNEAKENPLLYQLKSLEVEKARVEKWDGKFPVWFTSGATGGANLLFPAPAPAPGLSLVK
jgi:regulator of protease activity HflC (stomatin/prohibitin superfamily)